MPENPVLILGVEPRITVPVARSLHRLGVPVAVAGLSPPPHATDAITNAAEIKRAMFFMSSSVVTR